ncbi:mobilization protein [Sphingomonas sp. CFBP 13706]|uniref:mobilization protein n=1 Tax=Sphingomonas sp. CFBP 13706 TaxID=2775314 RepID=UPI00177BFC6D|nr:mobilization protein [Sphingomonas sp. CFBP 13706]MBD8737043.1 mobilization protein [Sphingomonas sp. CFBP 13706]
MAMFTLRLPDDLAAQFDKIAAADGGRSDLLRKMIERVCTAKGVTLPPLPAPNEPPDRIEVRLPKEDGEALEQLASGRRMKRTEWIVALIQSRLRAAPVPAIDHRQTLTDIRRELRAIGKNINQVVKAFHAANMEESRLEVGREVVRLAAMAESVSEQVEAIGDAMRGDLSYWRAGDE